MGIPETIYSLKNTSALNNLKRLDMIKPTPTPLIRYEIFIKFYHKNEHLDLLLTGFRSTFDKLMRYSEYIHNLQF